MLKRQRKSANNKRLRILGEMKACGGRRRTKMEHKVEQERLANIPAPKPVDFTLKHNTGKEEPTKRSGNSQKKKKKKEEEEKDQKEEELKKTAEEKKQAEEAKKNKRNRRHTKEQLKQQAGSDDDISGDEKPEQDDPPSEKDSDDEEDDTWKKRKKRKKKDPDLLARPGLPGRPDASIVFARRFWLGADEDCSKCAPTAAERKRLGITVIEGIERCPPPIVHWSDSRLPPVISDTMEALKKQSGGTIIEPSVVQSQGWTAALSGHDVMAIAETGSGKTLGYILPAVPHIQGAPPRIAREGAVRRPQVAPVVLVLVPTRELANQVCSGPWICATVNNLVAGIQGFQSLAEVEHKGRRCLWR